MPRLHFLLIFLIVVPQSSLAIARSKGKSRKAAKVKKIKEAIKSDVKKKINNKEPTTILKFKVPQGHKESLKPKMSSLISQSSALVRHAIKLTGKLQADADRMTLQLSHGNRNPGIGTKYIREGFYEARSKSGARVYFTQSPNKIKILGKSTKNDQHAVIELIIKLHFSPKMHSNKPHNKNSAKPIKHSNLAR